MPLLQNENWYACLEIKQIDDLLDAPEAPVMPKTHQHRE
jgi:hypothetical protein